MFVGSTQQTLIGHVLYIRPFKSCFVYKDELDIISATLTEVAKVSEGRFLPKVICLEL